MPHEAYVEAQERRRRLHAALDPTRSVQVEFPGGTSAEHAELVEAYVAGELDIHEAYARTLARHRRDK